MVHISVHGNVINNKEDSYLSWIRTHVMKNKFNIALLSLVVWLVCLIALSGYAWTDDQISNETPYSDAISLLRRVDVTNNAVTSGVEFSADVVRRYPREHLRPFPIVLKRATPTITTTTTTSTGDSQTQIQCHRWGVVTTIFEPSEAIRRAVRLRNWCIVIVADEKSVDGADYMEATGWSGVDVDGRGSPLVVYLSMDQQAKMQSAFVSAMPRNSFARKNVGYLYAVLRGAHFVWDFDDDNQLNFWSDGVLQSASGILNTISLDSIVDMLTTQPAEGLSGTVSDVSVTEVGEFAETAFNPYPVLGCPLTPCWPRGFPLDKIRVDETFAVTDKLLTRHMAPRRIALVQSLGDYQPDVDAIFRLTQETPFVFDTSARRTTVRNRGREVTHKSQTKGSWPKLSSSAVSESGGDSDAPVDIKIGHLLLVPGNTYAPMNAQAALSSYDALWGLLLPSTVPGRVSDIWRSYFVQRILQDTDLRVSFSSSVLVTQDRNAHSHMGDFAAETQLYQRTGALLRFLRQWRSDAPTLPERIIDLWVSAFERRFIEHEDVGRQQLWLEELLNAGYVFPLPTTNATTSSTPTPPPRSVPPRPEPLPQSDSTPHTKTTPARRNRCSGNVKDLTFFFSDLHDGTRLDLSSLLVGLGFRVILGGRKQGQTPWPETPALREMIVHDNMSPTLADFEFHQQPLGLGDVSANYEHFKDDPVIQSVDVFACSFPASMCELWLGFNKTIMFAPAHRYQIGRCDASRLEALHLHIQQWASPGTAQPRHIIAAMSHYDREYMKYFLGNELRIHKLYSSALGYLGEYSETPIGTGPAQTLRREILAISTIHNAPMQRMVMRTADVVNIRDLYAHYTAADLRAHRAVIYYPLSVMSYKLTDLYALNVPILIPNPLLVQENINADRDPYCPSEFMASLTLTPHASNVHPYSPLERDIESTLYWYQLSDMLTWPHIIIFDSYEDLDNKLASIDFIAVSKRMVVENTRRRKEIEENLCSSLEGVDSGRSIPRDFDSTIKMGV